MSAVPIQQAAEALGERPGTLRRWIRDGAPVAYRGSRGRGHAALVDPDLVRAWLAASRGDHAILTLANELPEVLAAATAEAWRISNGVDKRRLAGVFAASWYMTTTAVLDHLRIQCPSVPDVSTIPDAVDQLRKIAR